MSLKRARKAKKLTLRKLAAMVGVSRTTILNYEKKIHSPTQETWIKLKAILDLPGEFSDYFDRKNYGPGRRKCDDSQCSIEGCLEKPVAKRLCKKHYAQSRSQSNKYLV